MLEELIRELGSIPRERIATHITPGTAGEDDLERYPDLQRRLYELVAGTLIEKPLCFFKSYLTGRLVSELFRWEMRTGLGFVAGPNVPYRLAPGLVRMPAASFVSWEHFPRRELPRVQVLGVPPDLAVEVVSPGNTEAEMQRKLREYFAAGTRLVWIAEPEIPRVRCYTSPEACEVLGVNGVLTGGDVLPGFELPIREWLDRAGKHRTE